MYTKKVGRVLLIVFLINALLVSTHKGEFWPFSIYPMFSQAGKPWTRAILRDVTDTPDSLIWKTTKYPEMVGEPVSTIEIGIDQIDFSNFVVKTKNWDEKRRQALAFMIGEDILRNKRFMAFKVRGELSEEEGVDAKALPFLLLEVNQASFNPLLDQEVYFKDESN